MIGKCLTGCRYGLGFVNDQSGDRYGLIVWQFPVHGSIEVTDCDVAPDARAAILGPGDTAQLLTKSFLFNVVFMSLLVDLTYFALS